MKRILSIILTLLLLIPAASFGAATLMPNPKVEFFNGSAPCSGCKIYTYESGTSTLKDTWTDSTKAEKNENPIKLNPRGEAAVGIWMDGVYSVKLTTSAGSVIWGPIAGVTGIADTTTFTEALNARSRWVESQAVPTYISATQFSALGDHTLTFPVERRVDIELGSSHVYGRVTASSFGSTITTITILLDSGSITNAISKVYVSLESPTNPSLSFKMIDPASNINSSGTNSFSGTQNLSGTQNITGSINSSGTNTLSGTQNITGDIVATSIKRLGTAFFTSRAAGKSLTAAHTAAAAVGGVVILDDPATQLSSSGTLTTTVPIIWQGGAINKTASDNIYFGASWSAGTSQTFIGFAIGDIVFGPDSVKEGVPAEWWGITGTADNVAINSAIASTSAPNVRLLSNKTYYIADSLSFSAVTGGVFVGGDMRSTVLQWTGASTTTPMFRLFGVRESQFKNFTVLSSVTTPLYSAFRSETKSGFVSTNNTFDHLFTQGTNSGGMQYAYEAYAGTGGDNNNDSMVFSDCSFNNYSRSAIYVPTDQTQSKGYVVRHSSFAGESIADYAIDTASSVTVFESMGGYHNISDFRSSAINDYVKVYGWNSEGSSRLYQQYVPGSGATGGSMPVLLSGIRFALNGLNADGFFIYTQSGGGLNLQDSSIGTGGDTVLAQIYYRSGALYNASITLTNVHFNQDNSDTASPFYFNGTYANNVHAFGVTYRNSGSGGLTTKSYIFDDGDATPPVFYREGVYRAANTAPTTITNFTVGTGAGAGASIPAGWTIITHATTTNTTIQHNGNISLAGGVNFVMTTDDTITLSFTGQKWVEVGRKH